MNIFRLDDDPEMAAQYHNDRHLIKMVTENSQLLSTCHRYFGNDDDRLYKSTHVNHPSNIWIREGRDNYLWTYELLRELLVEYDFRYDSGKHQRAKSLLGVLSEPPSGIPDGSTPMRLAMPEECERNDPVDSYRDYYLKCKRHLAKWSKRSEPYWWR